MHSLKKFSCVIIDDESLNINVLAQYINTLPYLNLVKTYNNPVVAIKEIAASKVIIDFLLLDIKMPELSGLEVANIIRHKVDKLIFISSHANYSLAAFDVLCNQYLLRPFSQQKFTETINKLIVFPDTQVPKLKESAFIKLGTNGKYLNLKFEEIIYINALEHYVIIHTAFEQHIQYSSLKEVEFALRGNSTFIRVHKSHIISKKHILSVYGNVITLTNNVEITIGATFKNSFRQFLNNNLLS